MRMFRVLLRSLSEICKLCFTMRNGLRYWQQTAQLAKWVQATANFVQPMGFSVLAIEKNCINEPIPISTTISMTPFFLFFCRKPAHRHYLLCPLCLKIGGLKQPSHPWLKWPSWTFWTSWRMLFGPDSNPIQRLPTAHVSSPNGLWLLAHIHCYGQWSTRPIMVNGQHPLSWLMGNTHCHG